MKVLNKMVFLSVSISIAAVCFTGTISARDRDRDRVIKSTSSQPTNLPTPSQPVEVVRTTSSSRPTLTNSIQVSKTDPAYEPLITKTGSSKATNAGASSVRKSAYSSSTTSLLDDAIKTRYGIRYLYGSSGPDTYDCSGFVWAAFQDAGINFTRSSARTLWSQSEPVSGDEQFKFGTLVFLNGLGHMGIVADENGFYHASSSKGITYSPFKGYWENRIVGFRKLLTE
ncbi:MAG: C40 family peptidase [Pyrinomonadaceae bacterium]